MTVAGWLLVDEVLQNTCIQHGHGRDKESEGNSRNWAELDVIFLEKRVNQAIEDWSEEENCDGIEVLHQVVGNAVSCHLCSLRYEVTRELRVDDPVNWVEHENLAGLKSSLQFFDELVIPRSLVLATKFFLI